MRILLLLLLPLFSFAQDGFPVLGDDCIMIVTKGDVLTVPSTMSVAPMEALPADPMPEPVWYATGAILPDAYDGDSYRFQGELGWGHARLDMTVRANGIDTPELRGNGALESRAGKMVRDYVRQLFASSEVILRSEGRDKYGRELVTIWLKNSGLNVNDHLVQIGVAKRYDGGTKSPFTRAELLAIIEQLDGAPTSLSTASGRWLNFPPNE